MKVELVWRRGEATVNGIRDTIFRVASMTKPVIGAATMILVDEGKLRLDEPVDGLLPELANRRVLRSLDAPIDDTVPAKRAITVRDLLTFTFGIGIAFSPAPISKAMSDLELGQGMPQVPPPPDEWMRRLGTLPLMHQPGERWMYHSGADVLGVLVARASRKPLDVFMHERIFEPLGMKDTAFYVPASKLPRFVPSYLTDAKTGALSLYDPIDGQWSKPPAFPSGGGGLVSTADDFLAFGRMLLEGGGKILRADSVREMTRDQLTPEQKKNTRDWIPGWFDDHGWGLCTMVVTGRDDSGAPGAHGWDGGFGTSFRVDPKESAIRILLTQESLTSPRPPKSFVDFWRVSRTP
jgi:CubicO group peptidase (beta-lactamase class C family)